MRNYFLIFCSLLLLLNCSCGYRADRFDEHLITEQSNHFNLYRNVPLEILGTPGSPEKVSDQALVRKMTEGEKLALGENKDSFSVLPSLFKRTPPLVHIYQKLRGKKEKKLLFSIPLVQWNSREVRQEKNGDRFFQILLSLRSDTLFPILMKNNYELYLLTVRYAAQDQTLFFSIPYDKGWKVTIDGKEAKTHKIGDAFLGVKVPSGEHTVSLKYTPPGFSIGWKVSLAAAIIFIVYIGTIKRKSEKGIEDYTKWKAFKKFLNDFGTFDTKELPEIILWERYLVYATIFGLADKVEKAMNVKIKELDVSNMYGNNYIFINNYNLTSSINHSINQAYQGAQSTITRESASASGGSFGGHGGGFSSGGGFGGGGGGGRGF